MSATIVCSPAPEVSRPKVPVYKYADAFSGAYIEPIGGYAVGAYYPARIGEKLHCSRYHIVHKLGYGSYSTIWLARDEHTKGYVAIKIAVSGSDRPFDSSILKVLHDTEVDGGQNQVGEQLIPKLIDEFEVMGPEIHGSHRKHQCLATMPARFSVASARDTQKYGLFQLPTARAIASQLAHAIAFMHTRGVIHGDLHENNMLLCLPAPIHGLSIEQLYEQYRHPKFEKVERNDGLPLDPWMPEQGVVPVWLGGQSRDHLPPEEAHLILNDFGESFQPATDQRQNSHTPLHLRSLELLFEPETNITFSAEIWSLACAIFGIISGRTLFDTWFMSKDSMIAEHMDALGRLPEKWWSRWSNREEYFDTEDRRVDDETPRPLRDRIESSINKPRTQKGLETMGEEEKHALLGLLERMLALDPLDRPTAEEVLKSAWMIHWGTPAWEAVAASRNSC